MEEGELAVRYKPNRAGLQEVLRLPGVQSAVQSHGNRLAASAGDGYVASFMQGRSRYRGIVYAESMKAKRREARENVLLRVLG